MTRLVALAGAALVAATAATAAATAATASAAPARHAPPTQRVVVRPVDSTGHVAGGFTRKDEDFQVDCSFNHGHGTTSPVAVDPHIFSCSPDSAGAIACWDAASAHHVLCFLDAFRRQVIRQKGTAPTHLAHPSHPHNAVDLLLANGEKCFVRVGGAVGRQKFHPNWIATYFCGTGADTVWSPPHLLDTFGTDRTLPRWTVWVGTENGHLHQRSVTTAYFLGTAG